MFYAGLTDIFYYKATKQSNNIIFKFFATALAEPPSCRDFGMPFL
jgi:hypothetical protein